MKNRFRRKAKQDLDSLMTYWREIEYWLKRAEIVSKKARIPAINELRYASRQLFNATRIYGKYRLSEGDISVIQKRIYLAEQYLMNADHDICDGILKFFDNECHLAESEVSAQRIHAFFYDYHKFKNIIEESQNLVQESRHNYEKRKEIYLKLREVLIPQLIDYNNAFKDGYAKALHEREQRKIDIKSVNAQMKRDKEKITTWRIISTIATCASAISIPLSIYLWFTPPEIVCKDFDIYIVEFVCEKSKYQIN